MLLVASYRPDELHRRHPLRSLLAELERNPHARRLSLAPLTLDELAGQLEDILGEPPAAELLDRLWTRSGGNPLYVEELLAAGLDGRGSAPDTLRDALMLRVERLSEAAQELLRLVAVGQRLDHALLVETSALEPRALRDALREAVDGHILVADEDGTHRFRHALLREVVDDDLLPGERSALHLALARAVERAGRRRRRERSSSAAVAHHYAAAGDQPAALAASVRAAADAERVHAHGEAARCSSARSRCGTACRRRRPRRRRPRRAARARGGGGRGARRPGTPAGALEAAIEALGPDARAARGVDPRVDGAGPARAQPAQVERRRRSSGRSSCSRACRRRDRPGAAACWPASPAAGCSTGASATRSHGARARSSVAGRRDAAPPRVTPATRSASRLA